MREHVNMWTTSGSEQILRDEGTKYWEGPFPTKWCI